MAELNYKASNIAKAERELNANFFATLEGIGDGTPSFSALLMIVRAGGLTEQEADDLLDSEGIEKTLQMAVDALGQAGFLAKMKANAEKTTQSRTKETSQSTGVETKA
jgi:hypothetical protein